MQRRDLRMNNSSISEISDYANINETDPTTSRDSVASRGSSSMGLGRQLMPSAAVSPIDGDDDDAFEDDGGYEELPADRSDMSTTHYSNGATGVIEEIGGAFDRDPPTGCLVDVGDGFNAEMIQNMKTRLRPTVTKNFLPNPKNTEDDSAAMKQPTNSHRLRQNKDDVIKSQITNYQEAASGVESIGISMKNSLKPIQPRQDNADRSYYCNDQESIKEIEPDEMSSPTAADIISRFNSSQHQRIGNNGPPGQTTPIKASHPPKFNLGARTSSDESEHGMSSGTHLPRPNGGSTAVTKFRSPHAQQPIGTVTRFASLTLPRNDVDDDSDEDFELFRPHGRLGKSVSEDRSSETRINNGIMIRQDSESILDSQQWYFGGIGREISEEILNGMLNETGSFMVRESYHGGNDSPYALSVVYNGAIYHLSIRRRQDGKFSLGRPKENEKVFHDIVEMIAFHHNNPIELIGDRNKGHVSGRVVLKKCPSKNL